MISLRPDRLERQRSSGFSLIELMVVVAIIGLMISLSVVSMGSTNAARLNEGGNEIVNRINQARQNAMTRGTLTAVIVVRDSTSSANKLRAYILMERDAGAATWSAITKWQLLPTGVVADQSSTFFSQTPSISISNLPKLNGTAVAADTCGFQIFYPDGRLSIQGVSEPDQPVLRVVAANGSTANYYDIKLNLLTGIPKVERP